MHMQDVSLFFFQYSKQGWQRQRIKSTAVQIRHVNPESLEIILRLIPFSQTNQRNSEPLTIEAGNHPCKESLDAVHPRTGPPEMITDVYDIQLPHSHPCSRYHAAVR